MRRLNSNEDRPQDNESEDRRLVRGSILGTLSDDEQLEFDRRFIETPTFAGLAHEVESDLVDAYAAGELSSDEEEALRKWSLRHSNHAFRLQSAIALRKALQTQQAGKREQSKGLLSWLAQALSPLQITLAAGAVCLLLILATLAILPTRWLRPGSHNEAKQPLHNGPSPGGAPPTGRLQPSTSSAASTTAIAPTVRRNEHPLAGPVFTAMILADESRDQSQIQLIAVPADCKTIQLQLGSESDIPSGHYSLLLTSAKAGINNWQKSIFSQAGASFLAVRVPARFLPDGMYRLVLQPTNPTAHEQPLSFRFQIEHR